MKRTEFLKKFLLAISGTAVLPNVLSSCGSDEDELPDTDWKGSIAVLGAGAAGMHAAYLLANKGHTVSLLEASDRKGGRVRKLDGFADFSIELGGEFIHGSKTSFYDLAVAQGAQFVADDPNSDELYWLDNAIKVASSVENDPDLIKIAEFMDSLESYTGADITMEQYIQANKANFADRILEILNAEAANPLGTSTKNVGLLSLAKESYRWTAGDTDYLVKNTAYVDLFDKAWGGVINPLIKYNWQAKQIDYSGAKISVTNQTGEVISVDKVILAVPLTVLKDSDISFTPALSSEKVSSFSKIGMDPCMKIILKFSTRFWPENITNIVGTSGYVPEFWVPGYGKGDNSRNILTGFIMAEKAKYLSDQGDNAINIALSELDNMFGNNAATSNFLKGEIMDWTKHPYIRGGYSYPMPGTEGQRPILAAPVQNKLFFAGEATHTEGHNQTIHGAIETGLRAVQELLSGV